MTRKMKVDINILLKAFELYEEGYSFLNVIEMLSLNITHGNAGLEDGRGKGKPQSIMTEEEIKDAEIKALKERNKYLEMENEVLKKRREFEREMMNQKVNKSRRTKRSKR